MGKKDIVTRTYMEDEKIFADVFNFFLYDGKQVIHPGDLKELDTKGAIVLDANGIEKAESFVQKERDVLKYLAGKMDGKRIYLLLGLESQSEIHYAMPVKTLLYDSLCYAKQVEKTARAHREAKDYGSHTKGEFLSGFYKEDRLIPVITLVLCFTPEEWDAPKRLHEMLAIQDKEILPYVNDYKINLLSPAAVNEKELEKFHTSLKQVMSYIKYSNQKEKLKELVLNDERFQKMDRKAVEVINICTGSEFQSEKKGETEMNMCKALVDLKQEGVEEGLEQGKDRLNQLYQKLKRDGRMEDLIHAIDDKAYREQLLTEDSFDQ